MVLFYMKTNVLQDFHICISVPLNQLSEFVSTCKKSGHFINSLLRFSQFKNLAVWLSENILAYISGTRFFFFIWNLGNNTPNNINFHFRPMPEKNNDNISQNSKNPIFDPFWDNFPQPHQTHQHAKFHKKTTDQFRENLWKERWKDGRTQIHRALPATTRIYNVTNLTIKQLI